MKKTNPDQLAILGGTPIFTDEIHVGQVNLPDWDAFEHMFSGIFERGYYANHGPLVAELESSVARRLDVRHAICVTNGTVALMVGARALGLRGEVIVPSFTFPGTAQALTWAGLTPVFADVDRSSHTSTAATVEPLISPRTTAVLGVHLWGSPCDPDSLQVLCDHHQLALFFDAAHAFGCAHRGRMIGHLGRVETFSFHATKIVSGAEGGCLTTDDDELARRIRTVRNFHLADTDLPVGLRINGKMSEAQAAMALLSLANFDTHRDHNKTINDIYRLRSSAWHGIRLHDCDNGQAHNFQYAVIEVDEDTNGLGRDALVDLLRAENVLARRYFDPGVHRLSPYSENVGTAQLPVTDVLCRTVMQIPLGPCVTEAIAHQICDLIELASTEGAAIAGRLTAAARTEAPDRP
jgi:dTDP-4-amino-4,6-dideoxygalactose transaminase